MAFSCIIVDDDPLTIDQLVDYIGRTSSLVLTRSFSCPLQAKEEINRLRHPIDFLFVDVDMPGLNGFDLIDQIRIWVNCIILVTGHLQYAIDGYSINAKQFLGKPFSFKKFEEVVNNSLLKMASENPSILIRLNGKNHIVRLFINDIILIEGASNYIKIHTTDKIYVPYIKMSTIEDELRQHSVFRRVNKSFIISSRHIVKVETYKIRLTNNLLVSVGRSYRNNFDSFLFELYRTRTNRF